MQGQDVKHINNTFSDIHSMKVKYGKYVCKNVR